MVHRAYVIQLRGCAWENKIEIIHLQSKVLRSFVNAPWHVRNNGPHRDLSVEIVADEIKTFALKHEVRLLNRHNT